MKVWSSEDDETILRLIGLGKTMAEIGVHFSVPRSAISGRVHRLRRGFKPRKGQEPWSDEKKELFKASMILTAEDEILRLLNHDGNHTAKEISELVRDTPAGQGFVWEALIAMEKTGLVWRAHHFDACRANHWEITGCGRIVQQTPGA